MKFIRTVLMAGVVMTVIAAMAVAGQVYSVNWYEWANPGIGPTTEVVVISSEDTSAIEIEVKWPCKTGMCTAKQEAWELLPGTWVASFAGITGVVDATATDAPSNAFPHNNRERRQ